MSEKDLLWLHLRDLPYFRSLLRAVEARFYEEITLPEPVLDVGSGDGHFAKTTFDKPIDVGLDPMMVSLKEAANHNIYRLLVQAKGNHIPIADQYFASAVSNSVLEHISDVEKVLEEIARVLKPDAPFIFCVPNQNFLANLSIGQFLDRLKIPSLGDVYRAFFNRISRHSHCDPPEIWKSRLEQAGFRLEKWWHYFPPEALHVLEWGHYFGLPSLVSHHITGRWVLVPQAWNLFLIRNIIQPYYDADPVSPRGVYSFYIAKRI